MKTKPEKEPAFISEADADGGAVTVVEKPDTKALTVPALDVLAKAKALTVRDAASYATAGDLLKLAASGLKAVESFFKPKKQAFDALKKSTLLDPEKEASKPYLDARSVLEPAMLAWQTAETARREAEARKAREAAEKAERERRAAEAKAAEEAAAKAAEEGDLDAAVAAQEEAQAIAAAPVYVPAPVVAAPVEKVAGIGGTLNYGAKLVDAVAFLRHVLATPDLAYLIPKMAEAAQSEIRDRAKRQKELFTMPGWELTKTQGLMVRA